MPYLQQSPSLLKITVEGAIGELLRPMLALTASPRSRNCRTGGGMQQIRTAGALLCRPMRPGTGGLGLDGREPALHSPSGLGRGRPVHGESGRRNCVRAVHVPARVSHTLPQRVRCVVKGCDVCLSLTIAWSHRSRVAEPGSYADLTMSTQSPGSRSGPSHPDRVRWISLLRGIVSPSPPRMPSV